jgi:ferredoxin-NADP reductase
LAVARSARIEETTAVGASGRVFDLALAGEDSLGFVGGQYVIVDTGVDLPNGKRAKRAYSIVSGDDDQQRFRVMVKKLPSGPGSSALHAAGAGSTVTFSGPWGKHVVGGTMNGPTLVFATDTGITAAMGLVVGRAFSRLGLDARVVWYVGEGDFVPEALVREHLGAMSEWLVVEPALPVGHPERAAHAAAAARRHVGAPEVAFLSGDGAVVHPLREAILAMGVGEDRVCVESFFNTPARKAP